MIAGQAANRAGRLRLSVAAYARVKRSLAPFRDALADAARCMAAPDGQSARDYARWHGQPGGDRFCLVDFCGNAIVLRPAPPSAQAGRPLQGVEVTYIPGWLLQSALRAIVEIPTGTPISQLATLDPLFDGHDPLGQASWLQTLWIDMPVDMQGGAIGKGEAPGTKPPPQPLRVTLTETPECPHAPGFRPFHLHPTGSSWNSVLRDQSQIERLSWSRPRLTITCLTGVQMAPEPLGQTAVEILRKEYQDQLNARFALSHPKTLSQQALRLSFHRLRRPAEIPQGWQAMEPNLAQVRPEAFLPPVADTTPSEERAPYELPPDPEAEIGWSEDDVILGDGYGYANLPPAEGPEPAEPPPVLGPAIPPVSAPPAPLPRRALPSALRQLYAQPPERHLQHCLKMNTASGTLLGFFSRKAFETAGGKDLSFQLSFLYQISAQLAMLGEKLSEIQEAINTGDPRQALADVMVLEPLLLDLSYSDPRDGNCHFEISVEMLQESDVMGANPSQPGQTQQAPAWQDQGGTDLELSLPRLTAPKPEQLPRSSPQYRVRIRHCGALSIGFRQPISNLLGLYLTEYLPQALPDFGLSIAGMIDLYVEPMEDRRGFDTLPYERWRATPPNPEHHRPLGSQDVRSHLDGAGLFGDMLNELYDSAALIGGFTPAAPIFDGLDLLHLASYLTTLPYNLIQYGEPSGRTLFGHKVDGMLEPAMMFVAAAPMLSRSHVKAGFQIIGASGAFGLLGWTAWDAATNASVPKATASTLAKRYGGYAQMQDRAVTGSDWWGL